MSFKDDLKDDVQKVFCNSDEFFEELEVDGKPMMISIDEDELIRRNRAKGTHEQCVHDKQVLFYVAGDVFGAFPAVGRVLRLDKKNYLVAEAKRQAGIYEILVVRTNA